MKNTRTAQPPNVVMAETQVTVANGAMEIVHLTGQTPTAIMEVVMEIHLLQQAVL